MSIPVVNYILSILALIWYADKLIAWDFQKFQRVQKGINSWFKLSKLKK